MSNSTKLLESMQTKFINLAIWAGSEGEDELADDLWKSALKLEDEILRRRIKPRDD